jgi:DNA-binding response OmpR family regulator
MKVLVAEDDPATREGLVDVLEMEGYEVAAAVDGVDALRLFEEVQPDFVCLDVMMPGQSGYDVCRELRRKREDLPIMFISAKSEEIDRVLGLELGADDFIVKPFGVREVVARIRAITRRCASRNGNGSDSFQLNELKVMPAELRAQRGEEVIDLSLRDVRILQLLAENEGVVLTRNKIYAHAWGGGSVANSRCLDQHIAQLRKRVEIEPRSPQIISTVHGVGYRYQRATGGG